MKKKKLTSDNISRVFEVSELISTLDKNDPHYLLKMQNILKGYTHNVKSEENSAAIFRTRNFNTTDEFRDFLRGRAQSHGEVAGSWFTSKMDSYKLKHFYGKATNAEKKSEKCTSPGNECKCWEIKK